MGMSLIIVITSVLGLAVGSILGYYARQTIAKKQLHTAEGKASNLLEKAKKKSEDILLKAKNKAIDILEEAKQKEQERESQIMWSEKRLEKREESLDNKTKEVEQIKSSLKKRESEIEDIRKKTEETKKQELKRLQKIAGLSKEQAKKILLQLTEEENREFLAKQMKKLEIADQDELEKKARDIMVQAIQKYAGSQAAEVTTSVVSIGSDEIKGRIIGREGRNIKTLERLTGVEIIVDDTPETIVISGFDPVRRETAKIALEKLIADGRIHPTKIEEAVEFAKKEITNKIREAGEAAAYDVGVAGLDPKLIHILGRLRYRTSFGQNALLHSLEVAHLSGALAAELGANVSLAKKAGLLHDIGKAIDHDVQGTHVEIGIKILEKFHVGKDVITAMKSHHEDYPFETPESMI
ncbi:MAG TPA: ribonuclease Y, partial [Candidatus Moranbacteria bacterium]|nr:ribonuclease Y [Candidatus Moranbacteria bacterium]